MSQLETDLLLTVVKLVAGDIVEGCGQIGQRATGSLSDGDTLRVGLQCHADQICGRLSQWCLKCIKRTCHLKQNKALGAAEDSTKGMNSAILTLHDCTTRDLNHL